MTSRAGAVPLAGWALWQQLLLIGFLWGASFPLLRQVAGEMEPMALAAIRAGISGLAIAAFLWFRGSLVRVDAQGLWDMLVIGTLNGWLPNILTAMALGRIEAAPAALIQSSAPLLVGILAGFLLIGERPGPRSIAGLGIGFLGIAVIIGPGALAGGASLEGAVLMLVTALSYSLGTVYVRARQPAQPQMLALGQQVVACVIALALALTLEPLSALNPTVQIWGLLLLMGIFTSAIPLAMFTILLTRARATDAAMVGYLQPLAAALIAAVWLAEWPEPRVLGGGGLVLVAVWIGTLRR